MSDEHAEGGSPEQGAREFDDFGEYTRFQAASHASLAETIEQGRRQISEVVERLTASNVADGPVIQGPSLDELLTGLDEGVQRMKLVSSLNAAQAVAWDHMQAHGGPDNPDAYADYGAATDFHASLIPGAPGAETNVDGEVPTGE